MLPERLKGPALRLMPVVFVWLWSTGFIGAKYGLPYAEPFTLLMYRMLATLVLLGILARLLPVRWPTPRQALHTAVVGLLIHGLYLGGVFYAIEGEMPAGLASLIVGLQPLLTALAAVLFLREQVSARQWLGLLLGLGGVSLVLMEKLGTGPIAAFPLWTLAWILVSLLAISLGTVYQKRYCGGVELIPGTVIQYCAAGAFFALGAFAFETRQVEWETPLLLAMGWLVLGLSIGAILLLMALIREGAASRVASLFYLVPPVTALEAYLLFDERFGVLALTGGALAVLGVALAVVRRP
ncbi:DMT family transporter [Motiliproteus sp. SC1-56]|uniref:DMT family transporter n=1 Tax=Motiliproteus sp. SC1-56 TaxID=2799565 RepID=UPI001A906FEE|nr:DMT family transporter [Motiliproteus sp. SC1-56]